MQLQIDTREQQPLEFPKMLGVEVITATLPVGDYGAIYGDGTPDTSVVERKNLGDLFTSFTSGYEQERNKIIRAQTRDLTYILAIEATWTEIRKGHSYWKAGELHESRKTGLAMVKQLCTLQRKYGVQVWACSSRTEMAWQIQEYFLAGERLGHHEQASLSLRQS